MKLADTSFLIDYARGDGGAIQYLEENDEPVGASTIVLSELYRGLMHTQDMTVEEAQTKYEWVEALAFTRDCGAQAAEIYVRLREEGELIPRSDIYIAGTAMSAGVPIVTRDRHFDRIDGLDVETY